MTASSFRPSSHRVRSPGGTKSASWRLRKLRHLPAVPSTSATTTSVRPPSLRLATTFDPMNPAPPVTNSIRFWPCSAIGPLLCLYRRLTQQGSLGLQRRNGSTSRLPQQPTDGWRRHARADWGYTEPGSNEWSARCDLGFRPKTYWGLL